MQINTALPTNRARLITLLAQRSAPTLIPRYVHNSTALRALIELNTSSDVQEKRAMREDLRSFNMAPDLVHLPRQEQRSFTVPDGTHQETRTTTDSEGNSHTETVTVQDYSTVEITLYFKNGNMHVVGESKTFMAAGFSAHIEYHDGQGSGIKPRTGESFTKTNEPGTMSMQELGLDPVHMTWDEGSRLVEMFGYEQNIQILNR